MKKGLIAKTIPIIPGDPGNHCETRKKAWLPGPGLFLIRNRNDRGQARSVDFGSCD